mmetsp:Transcript_21572/g.38478  ORF Transcript_21572/g.38478 Transcript_21572/m.38478 type:complete len:184 (-) Transcript_21572:227-778(-)|eukprot:CAMPEP_0177763840 /NCGR_PEP_ID=MMETSP0491_2-20121128/7079_1 /TAXON_ID=63592 /ORGANISM="Tetraselmis chuii, Strain PLY429" /LENGTH=183 /DNA_ID=CAMNT_0019279961 /DNA_START=118 /DNA_END=669 /DNA_ORIENTATION=-
MAVARPASLQRTGKIPGLAVVLSLGILLAASCCLQTAAAEDVVPQDTELEEIAEEVAAFEVEEREAEARLEADEPAHAKAKHHAEATDTGKPSAGRSHPPPPPHSPQTADVIKIQVAGEEVSPEEGEEVEVDYNAKLEQIKKTLANKASERAAKMREAKEWVQKKMASSKGKTRQQRRGKEEL